MAPPRKPNHLKAIAGTAKPSRTPPPSAFDNLSPLTEVPPMPSWLPGGHAAAEWNRLAPIMIRYKLLNDANIMAFAMLCAAHGTIVETYAAKMVPTAAIMGQYRQLINEFGLTPASASKARPVGEGGGGESSNPFARNGRPGPAAA